MSRQMKDSGIPWIGAIPENWKSKRFKYSGSFQKGKLPSNTNDENIGLPIIGASEMLGKTPRQYSTDNSVPICNKNDILILWDGANAGLIASNLEGIISSTAASYTCHDKSFYWNYIYYLLKSSEPYFKDKVFGTTIPHMNLSYIDDIPMLLPPFEDQKQIADFLDQKCGEVDEMVSLQEKIIEELKAYKQSVITEAVCKGLNPDAKLMPSDIDWIGKKPEHWKETKVKWIAKTNSGSTPKNISDSDNSVIIWIRTTDINDDVVFNSSIHLTQEELSSASCPILEKGTCVVAMYGGGGTIGKAGFLGCQATINQALCSMEVNKSYFNKYLFYVLRAIRYYWMKYAVGTRKDPNINQEIVKNMIIPMPPFAEQKQIAEYLDQKCAEIDSLVAIKQQKIEELKDYKKSIIYEYITGKKEVAK